MELEFLEGWYESEGEITWGHSECSELRLVTDKPAHIFLRLTGGLAQTNTVMIYAGKTIVNVLRFYSGFSGWVYAGEAKADTEFSLVTANQWVPKLIDASIEDNREITIGLLDWHASGSMFEGVSDLRP